jgi:Ribonuclease G/E
MIGTVIALGMLKDQKAAAFIKDGRLEDLIVDASGDDAPPAIGSIYRARGGRMLKGMGGAMLDMPNGESAYLKGNKGLKPGAPMLVQVTHMSEDGKAVPVTTRLIFKSKYAIITPDAPGLNISRAIRDEDELLRLHDLANAGMDDADEAMGLILRSACDGANSDEIADDIANMRGLAEAVTADAAGSPELLVDGPDAWDAAWRDWDKPDIFDDSEDAFDNHGVYEMIDDVISTRVSLKTGGHAYIEPTRALVSVDVNTGGEFSAAAGLKANMALARDLPRQLRLRGLAGQITIDLAPMPKKEHRAFEQSLRAAFKADGSEVVLAGFTPLGHYEIQKKRERVPLQDILK